LRDVPDYLGASQRQVEILYRAGSIKRPVPRKRRGAVRNVVFGRVQIEDLLNGISDLSLLDETNEGNFHSVSYACQRGVGRFEAIFIDILEGLTAGFRHSEKSGVSAIDVDVRSLVSIRKVAWPLPKSLPIKPASAGFFLSFHVVRGIFSRFSWYLCAHFKIAQNKALISLAFSSSLEINASCFSHRFKSAA
jgi:hypothetical protein